MKNMFCILACLMALSVPALLEAQTVRAITQSGHHVSMNIANLGGASVTITTAIVPPISSDGLNTFLFSGLIHTGGQINVPLDGHQYWYAPFNSNNNPFKLEGGYTYSVTCECPNKTNCGIEGELPGTVTKCKYDQCDNSCTMIFTKTPNTHLVNGPGVLLRASTVIYNGVAYN